VRHSEYITTGGNERLRKADDAYRHNAYSRELHDELNSARRDVKIEAMVQIELDEMEARFQAALLFLDSTEFKEKYIAHPLDIARSYALKGAKA